MRVSGVFGGALGLQRRNYPLLIKRDTRVGVPAQARA